MPTTIEVQRPRPGVVLLTLNRPERLNAMNHQLISDLHQTLDDIRSDRSVRVVVLTGAGRGFCAGLDIKEGARLPGSESMHKTLATFATQQHISSLVPKFRSLPQPVIAAVNGAAAGGGLGLALASDIRLASESARFNVAFVKLGISGCDVGVSWLLPRLVGASVAFELLLTGRIIDAQEALRVRLVNRVVPDDVLVATALEVADEIVANSPTGVWMTKEVMWSQLEIGSLQAGIDLENRTQLLCSTTGDVDEAMAAFLEKRPPNFAPDVTR